MTAASSEPATWPPVSEPLSFSTLMKLRTCPRSWAYSRARFEPGGLFDNKGRLEERASWGAIRGRAAHKSLERLLDIHQQNAGPAAGSWALLQFWKRYLPQGGVPVVVAAALDDELALVEGSSRNRSVMQWLRQCAAREVGDLVAAVNAKLTLALKSGSLPRGLASKSMATRRELREGAHAEAVVEAELRGSIRARLWRGTIDVATIVAERVALIDYKGGDEDPSHKEQLELYALLYAKDVLVNPARRRAVELTLAYDRGRTIVWPAPDSAELTLIEKRTSDEIELLINSTESKPPAARPSVDACGFCSARALCSAYWNEPLSGEGDYFDLEMRVESRSSAGDELVGTASKSSRADVTGGSFVRLLVPGNQRDEARQVCPGDLVRVLGASAEPENTENAATVVVLGPFAEMLGLPSKAQDT